eukprot:8215767-Pyramimonas_sp.AAC.1
MSSPISTRRPGAVLRRHDCSTRGAEAHADPAEFNAQDFYHVAQFATGEPLAGPAAHIKPTTAKRELPPRERELQASAEQHGADGAPLLDAAANAGATRATRAPHLAIAQPRR